MTVKERLDEFIKHKGLKPAQFEKNCGISNGYIKNIRNSIGPDVLGKIILTYPELNKIWLLHGEGQMIDPINDFSRPKPKTYLEQRRAAMLEEKEVWFPVMQGNTRLKEKGNMVVYEDDPDMQVPIAFLPQNMYPGCDYGERAFGNSMYPRIVNQGFALGKVISKNHIKFGELYGIHFKQPEGGPPTVKYVHKCKDDDTCIILIADNKNVENQVIPLDEITFMFRVLYIVNPA